MSVKHSIHLSWPQLQCCLPNTKAKVLKNKVLVVERYTTYTSMIDCVHIVQSTHVWFYPHALAKVYSRKHDTSNDF